MGPSPESTPRPALVDAVDLVPAAERIATAVMRFIRGRQVHLYRIDAAGAGSGVITGRSYREGSEAVIAVADGGIGFDMKHHDRIFGIFERLHRTEEYPGTGVGLAIVRKVAERHGGRAWAQSTIGSGSTFFLAIPAA